MTIKNIFTKKADIINHKYLAILLVNILGWLVFLLGTILDNIYAGNFLNEQALAGVQIIAPFDAFITCISLLASNGFAIRFSNLLGKGEKEKAYKVVGLGFEFGLFIGVIIAIILGVFKNQLLGLFNLSPEVYAYASDYLNFYIGVAIIEPVAFLLTRLVATDGDPLVGIIADIGQVLLNAIISGILVRKIGIVGLGVGTLVSVAANGLIVFIHFFRKSNSVKFRFSANFKELGVPIKLGMGPALSSLFTAIVSAILNSFIISRFGDGYLASYSVVSFMIGFRALFICVPNSMSGLLSTANGMKNVSDLKKLFKLETKWCVIVTLVVSGLMCGIATLLPLLFGITKSSSQYQYSVLATYIIAPTFIFYGFMALIGNTYMSLEKPTFSIISTIFANLIFATIFPIIFASVYGYIGIIIGSAVSIVVSCILMVIGITLINKPHKVFVTPKVDEVQFSIDCYLTKENVANTIDIVMEKLKENNVEDSSRIMAVGLIEDFLYGVPLLNKKIVENRLTVAIGEKEIRIMDKHNGIIISSKEKEHIAKHELSDWVYLSRAYNQGEVNHGVLTSFVNLCYVVNRNTKQK